MLKENHFNSNGQLSGADQGFPVGWGANPLVGGAPTYDFAKFCEKLYEIQKILGPLNLSLTKCFVCL